mgnify:CR=1 FL=1
MKFMEMLMNAYLPYSFDCWPKWMYILHKWTAQGVILSIVSYYPLLWQSIDLMVTVVQRGFLCIYVCGPQVLHLNGRASHKCSMHACTVDVARVCLLSWARWYSTTRFPSMHLIDLLTDALQLLLLEAASSLLVSLVHLWSGASVSLLPFFFQWFWWLLWHEM